MRLDEGLFTKYMEFSTYELAAGGPDPHMRYVGRLAQEAVARRVRSSPIGFPPGLEETCWIGGAYMAFYNSPTAEVFLKHWPWKLVREAHDSGWPIGSAGDALHLEEWLRQNWEGLETRRERRTVRTPASMAKCLASVAEWTTKMPGYAAALPSDPAAAYDWLWGRAMSEIHNFGRYAVFKLLEFYRRYADLPIRMHDIRASGGQSPRETLALLYPGMAAEIAPKNNRRAALQASDAAADDLMDHMEKAGLRLDDYYLLEVFLCDFKQSWEGKRQYPGRSNDSELAYLQKIAPHWPGFQWQIPRIRLESHAHGFLGELNGWDGVRKELGHTLRDFGYTWSDALYVYHSDMDLAHPKLLGAANGDDLLEAARLMLPAS